MITKFKIVKHSISLIKLAKLTLEMVTNPNMIEDIQLIFSSLSIWSLKLSQNDLMIEDIHLD